MYMRDYTLVREQGRQRGNLIWLPINAGLLMLYDCGGDTIRNSSCNGCHDREVQPDEPHRMDETFLPSESSRKS
jgi:hypothetical protein